MRRRDYRERGIEKGGRKDEVNIEKEGGSRREGEVEYEGKSGRKRRAKNRYKVGFWIAGLINKDKDFWESLGEWDIIILSETWVVKGVKKRIKNNLATEFIWLKQWAGRKNKKGSAIGGTIMGIKKGLYMEKEEEELDKKKIMSIKIWLGEW